MAGEVLIVGSGGCPTFIPNGSVGQVLGIQLSGQPGYVSSPGGPSADAGNALDAGTDGQAYLACSFRGRLAYRFVNANTNLIPATDGVIGVDATAGNRIVTLVAPAACDPTDFYIRQTDNTANIVTVASAALINGAASQEACQSCVGGASLHVLWTGSTWLTI